ncbi:MAG TPA: FAD-dependent oxidoreductase [Candidatus Eisenbacteria bacterium]|nr:FAD-dependent oxidoreductase [Candidatus Eisenbacteria bacterium]
MSTVILGAGVTGLAAAVASGAPVFEATEDPGGICSSYYVRPSESRRLRERPADRRAYRFEIGGGHWIFGGAPTVLRYIESMTPLRRYERRSSVYLPDSRRYVPYPLQNHLRSLGPDVAARALAEMAQPARPVSTMREWLEQSFGRTLGELFFEPFHALYTAGLHDRIAPQDAYKSPVNLTLAAQGALQDTPPVGYNAGFAYPADGLGTLCRRLADLSQVRYGKRAVRIDLPGHAVHFADGSAERYTTLLSTLPLNHVVAMSGLRLDASPDPFTSVLVLNVGARRGPACPDDHWIYVPSSRAGFHRIGFYDNVDADFVPPPDQGARRVSIYVERAFVGTLDGSARPSDEAMRRYGDAVLRELEDWGFIGDAEVVDPTWIDVAYTWSWPGSRWVAEATAALAKHDVHSVGRYGRWVFQGIAESLGEGFSAGVALARV